MPRNAGSKVLKFCTTAQKKEEPGKKDLKTKVSSLPLEMAEGRNPSHSLVI